MKVAAVMSSLNWEAQEEGRTGDSLVGMPQPQPSLPSESGEETVMLPVDSHARPTKPERTVHKARADASVCLRCVYFLILLPTEGR